MTDRHKKALAVRKILITGEINYEMARYVDEAIEQLTIDGSPEIEVIITSNGGDVDMGLHIFDLIDTYAGATRGRVVSFARSMGAVILQACTTREAVRHAKILIHHISRRQVSLDTLTDPKKLEELISGMQTTQEKLYKILAGRTGKNREEIVKACLPDADMTSEEALAFGLISAITTSTSKDSKEAKQPE
jgi:ATP-dependent Clp protease protease subunit